MIWKSDEAAALLCTPIILMLEAAVTKVSTNTFYMSFCNKDRQRNGDAYHNASFSGGSRNILVGVNGKNRSIYIYSDKNQDS